jgi:hypothetical protein
MLGKILYFLGLISLETSGHTGDRAKDNEVVEGNHNDFWQQLILFSFLASSSVDLRTGKDETKKYSDIIKNRERIYS